MWRRLSIEHNLTHYYVPIIVMYERRYNVYITHYWAHPTHSRTTADTLYTIYHYQLDSLIIADYYYNENEVTNGSHLMNHVSVYPQILIIMFILTCD